MPPWESSDAVDPRQSGLLVVYGKEQALVGIPESLAFHSRRMTECKYLIRWR